LLVFILFLDSLFSLNFKKEERKEKKKKVYMSRGSLEILR